MGLPVSPPNLQRQQPIVVGDSVLSGREEAGIDSHVIFVPVETRCSVAGCVALSQKDPEPLRPGFQPQLCAITCLCDPRQHFHCTEPQLSSSVKWEQ